MIGIVRGIVLRSGWVKPMTEEEREYVKTMKIADHYRPYVKAADWDGARAMLDSKGVDHWVRQAGDRASALLLLGDDDFYTCRNLAVEEIAPLVRDQLGYRAAQEFRRRCDEIHIWKFLTSPAMKAFWAWQPKPIPASDELPDNVVPIKRRAK